MRIYKVHTSDSEGCDLKLVFKGKGMKKFVQCLLSVAVVAAFSANASDGTITINGSITANTCNITGSNGGDVTVTLPTIGTTSLATAGSTAGATPFDINLSGCPSGVKASKTYFESGPTVNQSTGNLVNSTATGSATNVEVQLLNNSYAPINLATNSNSQTVNITNGSATMRYYAQYIAVNGAASSGSVNTNVKYSMTYQ